MIRVDAVRFEPASGSPGTKIFMYLNAGEINSPADTLIAVAGTFLPEAGGAHVAAASVEISDSKRYTSFSITVPSGLTPDTLYSFYISLAPTGKGAFAEGYEVHNGEFQFLYKGEDRPIFVGSIQPSTVTKAQLRTTTFRITGASLDRLDTSIAPLVLSSPTMIRGRYVEVTASMAMMRLGNVASVQPGSYKVEFIDKDEHPVFSKINLTIRD